MEIEKTIKKADKIKKIIEETKTLIDQEEIAKIAETTSKALSYQTQRIFTNYANDIVNHVLKKVKEKLKEEMKNE